MVITLGGGRRFRFNHPAEAAVLRERRRVIIIVYMLLVVGEIQNTANLDFFIFIFLLIFRLVKETLAATTWIFALLQLTIGMTGLLDNIYIYIRVVQREFVLPIHCIHF